LGQIRPPAAQSRNSRRIDRRNPRQRSRATIPMAANVPGARDIRQAPGRIDRQPGRV